MPIRLNGKKKVKAKNKKEPAPPNVDRITWFRDEAGALCRIIFKGLEPTAKRPELQLHSGMAGARRGGMIITSSKQLRELSEAAAKAADELDRNNNKG